MIVSISKGYQLTIPADIRNELGISIGSRLTLKKTESKIILEPIKENVEKVFEEAKRIKPKHKLTAKQMDKLIENEIHRH
ncbi:hypothetical protein COT48_01455 [Candidatus Woesearchaeota archaeon CG08_land_8_20_14_0_20_47_9]|nr:MAG: hypothetical protein AUJ69_01710 [Candidatus Woesearchaeota archaeon CG1_02_47_18]PIO04239.1 MAG: hypothetical protein COT48_01455 [Candidatus Woesearchaeota archaeon CG08_land_8_20_14_0_20_47_9]HII30040.1 AbrB/MazE/SpoVT family DNA-binding domain-containing protein [Candidatus Woesearchaeota archaeon]